LWEDAPPIFITLGEESLEDEGLYFARKVHRAGVNVVLERFEGMPHCFAMFFPTIPAAKRCFKGWADFCLDAVQGRVEKTEKAVFINRMATKSEPRPLDEIGLLSEEEVQRRLTEGKDWQVEGEKELVENWEQVMGRAELFNLVAPCIHCSFYSLPAVFSRREAKGYYESTRYKYHPLN